MENQTGFDPSLDTSSSINPPVSSPPPIQTQSSKTPFIVLIVLIFILLVLGLVAFFILKTPKNTVSQSTPTPTTIIPTSVPTLALESTPTGMRATPSPSLTSAPGRRQFASTGISLDLPSGWTATEASSTESTTSITNGIFTLAITRDPIFTGGGVGFMFDGVAFEGDKKETTELSIAGTKTTRTSHIIPATSFNSQIGQLKAGIDNVYGGSVITTGTSFPPVLKLADSTGKTRNYLITYSYRYYTEATDTTRAYGLSESECQIAIEAMDSIVKSLKLE